MRINEDILNYTVHDWYLKLRLDKQNKYIYVVGGGDTEVIIAVY